MDSYSEKTVAARMLPAAVIPGPTTGLMKDAWLARGIEVVSLGSSSYVG